MCRAKLLLHCPPPMASQPDERHRRDGGWAGCFLSAFTSATLLPGSSEDAAGAMATRGVEHGQPVAWRRWAIPWPP